MHKIWVILIVFQWDKKSYNPCTRRMCFRRVFFPLASGELVWLSTHTWRLTSDKRMCTYSEWERGRELGRGTQWERERERERECMSVCLSVYLFICLSVCLSLLPVYMSVCALFKNSAQFIHLNYLTHFIRSAKHVLQVRGTAER